MLADVLHLSRSFLRQREATMCLETSLWTMLALSTALCHRLSVAVVSSSIDAFEDLVLIAGACVITLMIVGIIAMSKTAITSSIGKMVIEFWREQCFIRF